MELVVTTMMIQIPVTELQVGDVFNGKVVISVEPPYRNPFYSKTTVDSFKWQIMFSDGSITTPSGNTRWLVDRQVERIER